MLNKTSKILMISILLITSLAFIGTANANWLTDWYFGDKNVGLRTDNDWNNRGTYIETAYSSGINILINGSNKYINFNTTSGSSGYGFRDNSGSIEFKNSGGSWVGVGSGSGTGGGADGNWAFFNGSGIRLATTSNQVLIGASATTTTSALEVSGDISVTATSTTRTNFGLSYSSEQDYLNRTNIATWGDSLTLYSSGQWTSYPAYLASVTGRKVYNGGVSSEDSTQIKNRMVAATDKYGYPTVIWAGRNGFADEVTVQANIATMVATLTHTNYIVLSIINQNTAVEWLGGADYNKIIALNAALSATYGARFLDIRSYLIADGLTDASISPTAQDLTDIANDVIPTSLHLSGDPLHLNAAAYRLIALQINENISLLTPQKATVVTPENIPIANLGGVITSGVTALRASSTVLSIFVGEFAGNSVSSTSLANSAVGYMSMDNLTGNATYNSSLGYSALGGLTTGDRNTALGGHSMITTNTGSDNSAIGYNSMFFNQTGVNNVAIGKEALRDNVTGSQNTAVGTGALYANLGSNSTALGYSALGIQTSGSDNTGVGLNSLSFLTTGSKNVAIGRNAGIGDGTTPDERSVIDTNSTFIGYQASRHSSVASTTVLTNATAIGYLAKVGASNSIVFGSGVEKVGIGTTTPYAKLSVVGEVVGAYFTATTTTASTFLYASTTALSATSLCLTTDCRTTWPTSGTGGGLGWASTTVPDTNSIYSLALSNVGIGTTSPYAKLSVVGEVVGEKFAATSTTATSTLAGGLSVAGTTGFNVLQNGNIGIGTQSPISKLTIYQNATSIIRNYAGASGISSFDFFEGTPTVDPAKDGFRVKYDGVNNALKIHAVENIVENETRGLTILRSNGFVGFGLVAPAYTVDIKGTAGATSPFNVASSTGTSILMANANGNVGIGTTSPWRKLSVDGTVSFKNLSTDSTVGLTGAVCLDANNELKLMSGAGTCVTSSEDYKKNIQPLTGGLDWVLRMNPILFEYKDNNKSSLGFTAEEMDLISPLLTAHKIVQTIVPKTETSVVTKEKSCDEKEEVTADTKMCSYEETIVTTKDEIINTQTDIPYTVRYELLPAVLVKAIQELNAKIDKPLGSVNSQGNIDFYSKGEIDQKVQDLQEQIDSLKLQIKNMSIWNLIFKK